MQTYMSSCLDGQVVHQRPMATILTELLSAYKIQNTLRSPTILYFSAQIAPISITKMRTYSSFDIPNSITPQTTLRLLQIPVGLLVLLCTRHCRRFLPLIPSPLFSCPGQTNRRWSVPVPVTDVRYHSLL